MNQLELGDELSSDDSLNDDRNFAVTSRSSLDKSDETKEDEAKEEEVTII